LSQSRAKTRTCIVLYSTYSTSSRIYLRLHCTVCTVYIHCTKPLNGLFSHTSRWNKGNESKRTVSNKWPCTCGSSQLILLNFFSRCVRTVCHQLTS
jgi:hypothetical protein